MGGGNNHNQGNNQVGHEQKSLLKSLQTQLIKNFAIFSSENGFKFVLCVFAINLVLILLQI